ncbi:MAG: hypothetical protein ACRERD_32055 [Candidatus Binatia bacterium]
MEFSAEFRTAAGSRAPEKVRLGLLTVSDLEAFAWYAQVYSDALRLRRFLTEHGDHRAPEATLLRRSA